jgi:amino acid adenylation domain-containing protein
MKSTTTLVQDFLIRSAQNFPDKVALVIDSQRYTYTDLDTYTNRLANALTDQGIQRGDRVALFLPNSFELVVAIFGVLKAGAVFIVINHSTKKDKLKFILENSEAKAIVSWSDKVTTVKNMLTQVSTLKLGLITGNYEQNIDPFQVFQFDKFSRLASSEMPKKINIDLDLACLIYTSGSTGDPKGVMSDHSNIIFAVNSITSYLQNSEDDTILSALPLSFDYGLYQLLMSVSFGGTLVLEKGFVFPARILKKIEEERITGFPGVPTMFSVILNMDLSEIDLSSLRYMTNTAAALSSLHLERIHHQFPGIRFYSMYGLTETKRTLYLPPEDLSRKPDSVGIPIPGTEAWIENDYGERLGENQIGELVIRGRHVMRGYWKDQLATQQRFRPGIIPGERLCYSGDLFKMDEEGYFYFISRKDDIIKSRGEKVSPKEVENIIYQYPGVLEVAVIGVPDELLGQAIKAFIVTNDREISSSNIMQHCKKNLEDFMVPKFIEIRESLPKTSSGKIKKNGLF